MSCPEVLRAVEFVKRTLARILLEIECSLLKTSEPEMRKKRVIIVYHGMVMWDFLIRIERLTPQQFLERSQSPLIEDRIRNGQVIHFSQRDPDTGTLSAHCNWARHVCPWAERASQSWRTIVRRSFTNEELQDEVGLSPRLLA